MCSFDGWGKGAFLNHANYWKQVIIPYLWLSHAWFILKTRTERFARFSRFREMENDRNLSFPSSVLIAGSSQERSWYGGLTWFFQRACQQKSLLMFWFFSEHEKGARRLSYYFYWSLGEKARQNYLHVIRMSIVYRRGQRWAPPFQSAT